MLSADINSDVFSCYLNINFLRTLRYLTLIFAASFVLAGSGCKQIHEEMAESVLQDTNRIEWIKGTWRHTDGKSTFIERWTFAPDSTKGLVGQGMTLRGDDTTFTEQLSIEQIGQALVYVVRFPDRIIRFANTGTTQSTSYNHFEYSESRELRFVNDTNDFPREIIYTVVDDDSMYVTLKGDDAASRQTEIVLKMKRID